MTKTAKGTLAKAVTAAGGRGGALIILFLLVVAFAIVTPDFLSINNLINILRQYFSIDDPGRRPDPRDRLPRHRPLRRLERRALRERDGCGVRLLGLAGAGIATRRAG